MLRTSQIVFFPLIFSLTLTCVKSWGVKFGYIYKMPLAHRHNLCPTNHRLCSNGQTSYLCKPHNVSSSCVAYSPYLLKSSEIRNFMNAHNGIRNKVAEDLRIANMNLVYWSEELSEMASLYLAACNISTDPCKHIGEETLAVGQNYLFRVSPMVKSWPGRIVRTWYLEIGYNVKTWQQFMNAREAGNMENLTQIIWPQLEFVGCSAAKMFHGVLIACYYHPPFGVLRSEGRSVSGVEQGPPCTLCDRRRTLCSKTFIALCGIDVQYSGSNRRSLCGYSRFAYILTIFLIVN